MDDPPGTACPVCGWLLDVKTAEKVLMIPQGPRARNVLRHREGQRSLTYQFERRLRKSYIQDSFDGRVHRDFNDTHKVRRGKEWRAMAHKLTADPVRATQTNVSVTPTVLVNMSMHPHVRKRRGAMSTIMLFGKHFANFRLAFR